MQGLSARDPAECDGCILEPCWATTPDHFVTLPGASVLSSQEAQMRAVPPCCWLHLCQVPQKLENGNSTLAASWGWAGLRGWTGCWHKGGAALQGTFGSWQISVLKSLSAENYFCDPICKCSRGPVGCLAAVVPMCIICAHSTGHTVPSLLLQGPGQLSTRAGPQEEKSRGERLNLGLVCGETSQENELWHFAAAADKVPVNFLVNPLVSGGL